MKVDIGNYPVKGSRREKVFISKHDTYDLGHTLSLVILPALKKFKAYASIGTPFSMFERDPETGLYPDKFSDEQHKAANKKWLEAIDQMIYTFQKIHDDSLWGMHKDEVIKVNEGKRLFAQHFTDLWW